MNSKAKAFGKLFDKKHDTLEIARVSDLLHAGFDADKLSDEFVRINKEVWGGITHPQYLWTKEQILSHFMICPQIQYCAFERGHIVATLSCMFTTEDNLRKNKPWLEKTGGGFLTTHMNDGAVGFGVDLSVTKKASKKTADKIVLSAIFDGVLGEGLKGVYLGARIPAYHKNSHLDVEDYVFGARKNGKPLDPELYFYVKNGFEIVEIIPEYMEDPESLNYGVLIRWKNPLYKLTKLFPFLKPIIKYVGAKLFLRVPKLPHMMAARG